MNNSQILSYKGINTTNTGVLLIRGFIIHGFLFPPNRQISGTPCKIYYLAFLNKNEALGLCVKAH